MTDVSTPWAVVRLILAFLSAAIVFTVNTPPTFMSSEFVSILAWVGGLINVALGVFFANTLGLPAKVANAIKSRLVHTKRG